MILNICINDRRNCSLKALDALHSRQLHLSAQLDKYQLYVILIEIPAATHQYSISTFTELAMLEQSATTVIYLDSN